MTSPPDLRTCRSYAIVLGLLSLAFCGRVAAQLLQFLRPSPLLPPFEAWHSGALPYGILLATQGLLILLFAWVVVRVWLGRINPNPALGWGLLVVGIAYFGFMLFRLMAGLTFLSSHAWFAAPLPSIFHLALAAFVLTLAHFHLRSSARRSAGA